jgi:hypothetical protein
MAERLKLAVVLATMAVLAAFAPSPAAAAGGPEITHFEVTPSTSQAGGHPDLLISGRWGADGFFGPPPCQISECLRPRVVGIHFPQGFIGNPHVVPRCALTEFNQGACPSDGQVGIIDLAPLIGSTALVPVYNMEPRPDEAGLLGILVPLLNTPIFLELSGRTDSDYGLDSIGSAIPQTTATPGFDLYLWGVPAASSHDILRFRTPFVGGGACGDFEAKTCPGATEIPSTRPPAPFLQNPTACGGPLSSTLDLTYYSGATDHAQHVWPDTTGCQQIGFNPSQTVKPTTTQADTASGLDIDLNVPQTQSPTTPTPSAIKTNSVTLPAGFSINPGAADGKVTCSDAETSIGTLFAAQCPEFSRVGATEIDVSALPAPVFGGLYLGEPKPGEPYRLIITASGFATHIKLAVSVHADPETGQLTASVAQPQAPIQRVNLHMFGSERGLLATPEQCGMLSTESEFTPWNSALPTQISTSFLTIDSGPRGTPCPGGPRPFAPTAAAGSVNNTAGGSASFSLAIDRDDGDQNLTGLEVVTPPGFSATLKDVAYCPEDAIARLSAPGYSGRAEEASLACPSTSLVGSAVVGVGAGTHPLHVKGLVYLAGPYKGTPLSLVVVTPAVSGPYDLGAVAVRAAIRVDPVTAQVTTTSDPLPQILGGIPLRLRSILLTLDRPGFARNPTNCMPRSVETSLGGDEGRSVIRSTPFQVANCADLPYRPKLTLRYSGGFKRRGHPAIHTVLSAEPGEANSRSISVTLPDGQQLDNSHFRTICTRGDFTSRTCPSGAAIGHATLWSPILAQPLRGTAYLRSSRHQLPDIALDLEGQVDVVASGRVDSVNGRLRVTFEEVPDVPFSRVVVDFLGGSKGLLINSEDLCAKPRRAAVRMAGQNGVRIAHKTTIRIACSRNRRPR